MLRFARLKRLAQKMSRKMLAAMVQPRSKATAPESLRRNRTYGYAMLAPARARKASIKRTKSTGLSQNGDSTRNM